jgi:hypothetical protein
MSRATLMALLATAVLALSWPRLQAGFRYLPVDIAVDRFYTDRQIPSDRLTVLIRFAGQAINYHDHYRYHDGLSLLHYLRGLDRYTPALERRDAYRQAALHTSTGKAGRLSPGCCRGYRGAETGAIPAGHLVAPGHRQGGASR